MKIKSIARFYFGLFCGVAAILLFLLLRIFPHTAEILYGNGLFPVIRIILDYSLGILPFPVVYLFPLFLGYHILRPFFKAKNWCQHLRYYLNFIGYMIAAFYVLWGFNYARPDLSSRIDYNQSAVTSQELEAFGAQLVAEINELRSPELIHETFSGTEFESSLRQSVDAVLQRYEIDLNTKCRIRLVEPTGVLRRVGISGIYFPFTGEALLEKAHPLPDQLFVMAHEFAHSYGVTDEGEANLVAYLACIRHKDPIIRYAGHLAMWEYLSYTFRRKNSVRGISLKKELSPMVMDDLERLKAERRKYREWVPDLSNSINDTYLKAQGIEEGTAAYLSLPELYLRHTQND